MKLVGWILISTLLGYGLFALGPLLGGFIAFGIVAGCIFRGLALLKELNEKLSVLVPDKDKVTEAYEKYINEKNA
ncbi:hypothetical protein B5V88_04335 [Heyndrickxia sporothermodurans]|uniref:ATP-dependent Lon protease n=1 Tax=Heyndrickxia sporothermodurans TaxID=46224 RepID=A0A150L069_9BACI|nr:hypothetical protein [Heyndrickxia sporothermodurans]KYD05479.1 hypothetical protein B4102_3203 [Heyndrickxia sporothermodurans]MBL5766361.1 hypothetical protein [Heyndrickxia sporothermodurans]MBL5769800.1 hypothetical protein [Heyndrickxia sporothermodurans]MBL5773992.1 hypothetical protein [Heyndrickxia sporothermodurans]MBL5776880.1 hypothetical protein [Heyndrickxia sporothermodurans]